MHFFSFFCFLVIIFSGFILRLINLTLLPVFADEAIYIRWSQVMSAEPTLRFLPLSDGKQPLFMWVLMFLVNRISDPLFAGRIISVFSGIASLVGICLISYVLFRSKAVSLASGLLVSVSPYFVFFDRMALVDSMLTMWFIWTFVFGILTVKTRRLDMAIFSGFCLGFASLTKSSAIFAALLLPSTLILGSYSKKRKIMFYEFLYIMFLLAFSYLVAVSMYNIQRLGPNFHLLSSRTADYVFPISHLWENPLDPFKPHIYQSFEWIFMMGPWGMFLLTAYSLLFINRKNSREKVFLLFWFLIPLIIQAMYAKVFTARYLLFVIPPFFVLGGSAFLDFNKKSLLPKTLIGVMLFFLFQALSFDYKLLTNPSVANLPRSERSGYLEEWTAGTGIKDVAEYIKKVSTENPDVQIVVGTEGYFGTLPDGLLMYLQGTPRVVTIGVGLNIKEVPEPLVESRAFGNKTYLVVNDSRLKIIDPESHGLKLIESFEKAQKPDGGQERLLFFELI